MSIRVNNHINRYRIVFSLAIIDRVPPPQGSSSKLKPSVFLNAACVTISAASTAKTAASISRSAALDRITTTTTTIARKISRKEERDDDVVPAEVGEVESNARNGVVEGGREGEGGEIEHDVPWAAVSDNRFASGRDWIWGWRWRRRRGNWDCAIRGGHDIFLINLYSTRIESLFDKFGFEIEGKEYDENHKEKWRVKLLNECV
ncbi:PRA1 family protein F3 [Senna tora]|uniref:PRA1 family protein F3 n=1 Tax=Senna tora TaxID=362788 RepID=A0A834XF77_9FABA|nr:PRA1 family protein F3 [Senna tora]